MNASSSPTDRAYTNVMERLVAEEVARQKSKLPEKLRDYIKTVEVETYALNRLPALYASSEKGWQMQYEKAGQAYTDAVYKAVRQGIAAVQIDPLRASQPLSVRQTDESEAVLTTFRNLLNQPKLGWDDILYKCKRLLLPHNHPDRPPLKDESEHKAHWQPGTYGSTESWVKRQTISRARAVDSKATNSKATDSQTTDRWNDDRYKQ
ncbi:late competence development ComFB family protein [cf. Phormidesmis sp. LEGE 11477]|uniref:late competence development ComFB family protein n=1 Tax=cf. Phormidesmis sp. LEGE 11477 TaxID=1828680 RepID=UPI001880C32F|nr:late competence development ComFB family protein [cf. Phormidesmis sp. LEGE 11477]MBE9059969.1 late competence development ComFB family protein [cf. Phormidesmis sp. LEGE 11477]